MIQPVTNGAAKAAAGNGSRRAKAQAGGDEAQRFTDRLLAVFRSAFLPIEDQISDMPVGQLRVCTILFDGPRSMSALSKELSISLSAMTQLADRLERAQLVKRVFEGNDRRVRCLQLTPRGARIIRDREHARVRQISVVLEQLAPATRKQVFSSLEDLWAACETTKDQRRKLSETRLNGLVRAGQRREHGSVQPLEP